MATNDDNFREIYNRINALEQGQAETNGYLRAVVENGKQQYEQTKEVINTFVEQNKLQIANFKEGQERYIRLVWRMILILTAAFFAAIFAVIYGAIGERGLKSVRESMPGIPSAEHILNPAIPWHGDKIKPITEVA